MDNTLSEKFQPVAEQKERQFLDGSLFAVQYITR